MPTDPSQALQRLLDEAPHVRVLAQSLVGPDADEVVQQTWLQVVQHGGAGVEQPRPWLSRLVRHAVANLRRGQARRRAHEAAAPTANPTPSSAELLQREEQRRRLVDAVDGLPEPFREVVLLRYFEGLSPRAIAARLDLPATTVWNRNREAMRLLRQRLDEAHGGRTAWVTPLGILIRDAAPALPATAQPVPPAAATPLLLGALVMATKTKLVAAAAAILIVAGAVAWWQLDPWAPDPAVTPAPDEALAMAIAAIDRSPEQSAGVAVAPGSLEREAIATSTLPTMGSLRVNVRWHRDQTPAANVTMVLRRPGQSDHFGRRRQRTDADGVVTFEGLAPQRFRLGTDPDRRDGKVVDLVAGEQTTIDFEIPLGLDVNGIVVDPQGIPIGGALVESAPFTNADVNASPAVTVTDANGRFALRDLFPMCLLGARAEGYRASRLPFLVGKAGNTADVRIELGSDGGMVDGLVVDPAGLPVPDAFVVIGADRVNTLSPGLDGCPPLPAIARSDASGRFHAIGIATGTQPVVVIAANRMPWRGKCEIVDSTTIPMRIVMRTGAVLRGAILDDDGTPVADAEIRVGDRSEIACRRTVSAANGTFELTGLPEGPVAVHVDHDNRRIEQQFVLSVHAPTDCVVHLRRGIDFVGRVVDEDAQPIARAGVQCEVRDSDPWSAYGQTDVEGNFTVSNCPADRLLTVTVRANGYDEHRAEIDPRLGEVEFRLHRRPAGTAKVVGRVVDPDGRPLANGWLSLRRENVPGGGSLGTAGPDGRFEFGSLPAGRWILSVRQPDYPSWNSDWYDLRDDETWDLGDVRLAEGGRARVTVQGDREGVTFFVVNRANSDTTPLAEWEDALQSGPLAAGAHDLMVFGSATAAQLIPFVIETGQTTEVTVRLQAGVEQTFEVDTSRLADELRITLGVAIRQGEAVVARRWWPRRDGKATGSLRFLPGTYSVRATIGFREVGTTSFTVGAEPGKPVRFAAR